MKFVVVLFSFLISSLSLEGQTDLVISVYFEIDAHEAERDEQRKLYILYLDDSITITKIVSYTDKSGSNAHNKLLAQRRANTIIKLLSNPDGSQNKKPEKIDLIGEDYEAENYLASEYRRVDVFYRVENAIALDKAIEPDQLEDSDTSAAVETPLPQPKLVLEFTEFLLDSSSMEITIVLAIEFHGGTDLFYNSYDPELWHLFNILHYNENITALIRGHVCCGADLGLSNRRAYAVEKFLTDRSIPRDRLSSKGFSNTIPAVTPELTESDRRKNRRVDVIFYKNE